jgi:CheY-like chemotaxis protein
MFAKGFPMVVDSRSSADHGTLLVEDNPDDVVMIREAFEQSLTPIQLYLVSTGEQAIKFVRRTDPAAARPSIILLDLHLPIGDGLTVLADLKSDPEYLSIPIVVLTTSQAPDDVEQCYALHANAYIVKPSDFDGFAAVIQQIATCFLGLVSLPPSSWEVPSDYR